MNIKDELTCKHCNQIYNSPITLPCGCNTCKHHIEEAISNSSSNKFLCPLCDVENFKQTFNINRIIEKLVEKDLHKFEINSEHKLILGSFKKEIANLEALIRDPENVIYEKIGELKLKVDIEREEMKIEIDKLAVGLIQQLETFENNFKAEYKTHIDLERYKGLVELSRKQLGEYEKCLDLFSSKKEERDEKSRHVEQLVNKLRSDIAEAENSLFSNRSIKYKPSGIASRDLFGQLLIKVRFI
jgi:hypothetical protein